MTQEETKQAKKDAELRAALALLLHVWKAGGKEACEALLRRKQGLGQ